MFGFFSFDPVIFVYSIYWIYLESGILLTCAASVCFL